MARSLILAFLLLAPATAFAQDADIAQARALGQQAQTAYEGGNYAESERLWSTVLTLGLARAQSKNGKLVVGFVVAGGGAATVSTAAGLTGRS